MRVNAVSKQYFRQMISKSNLILTEQKLDENIKINIRDMQKVFEQYIDENQKENKAIVSFEDMLKNLTDKMNGDLEKIKLSTWKNIQSLCWNVRKYQATENNYHTDKIELEDLIQTTLKVYDRADKQMYLCAKSILKDKHTLIYLNNLDINNYYRCRYLQLNFIACDATGYSAYPSFIHESQHSIDHKLFKDIPPLFWELAPIFFETLMIDLLNKSGKHLGLYGERINNHNMLMNEIYDYVRILEKFENKGKILTAKNTSSILEVEDESELASLYSFYNNDDAIDSVKYIISFMRAIQIRKLYYNSKKQGIMELKDVVAGNNLKINYSSLIYDYEMFINEIETKNKVKKI